MGIFNFFNKSEENTVSATFPYQELYKDGTVLTKDWGLMKVWHIQYPDAAINSAASNDISDKIARTFQQHSDDYRESKTAYWFVMQRIPMKILVDPSISGEANMTSSDLEIEQYRNNIFKDVHRNSINLNYAVCKVSVSFNSKGITEASRAKAEAAFQNFESALRTIEARPTALTIEADDMTNRIIPFLKYMTGSDPEYSPFAAPKEGISGLSEFLSTSSLQKGKPMVLGKRYIQTLTISAFPNETYPNILSGLMALPFCFRWVTRWIPRNNFESQAEAKKMQRNYRAGMKSWRTVAYEQSSGKDSGVTETQAETDVADMQAVLEDLTVGETIGELTSVVVLSTDSLEEMRDQVTLVKRIVNLVGFDVIEEDVASNFYAWKSSLPGDSSSNRRKPWVTASNISHIVPFMSFYHGSTLNSYLRRISGVGWPHAIGRLVTGELYYLNLNGPKDDVGHFVVIGSTGGGKSILLAFMASQWMRYPDSRVILFDKDMSFERICRDTGGAIYIPTAENSDLQFMPLSRIRTKPSEAVSWLETVTVASNIELTPDISESFMKVCRAWDDVTPPTVERFTQRLEGLDPECAALPALKKLLDNSELAKLFGGETDEFNVKSFRRKTMIEMGPLMNLGNEAVLPALDFLFSRMDELFDYDPKPTLLILDEAWRFLSHPVFRKKIKEWLKTLRKKLVFVGFALQNIGDVDDMEEFLTSCHTEIFLPNNAVKEYGSEAIKDLYRKMGCTDDEIEIIGQAERKKQYFIKQEEGSALVDFCIDSFHLARISRTGV